MSEPHYHQEDPLQGCGLMIIAACFLAAVIILGLFLLFVLVVR